MKPMQTTLDLVTELAEELARLGGDTARARRGDIEVDFKNGDPRDVVSNIDIEISELLSSKIRQAFPDHSIHSEESATTTDQVGWLWSIDPIDGTSNYVRGLPHYSCVVTVMLDGIVQAAAVYAPVYDECFTFKGNVSYLNNVPLHVSDVTTLDRAQVNFHPGRKSASHEWAVSAFTRLLQTANKTVNLSSSALDLCFVAAGRTDIVVYGTLTTLDVAGALTIVRAAGGEVYEYETQTPVNISAEPQRLIATCSQSVLEDFYAKITTP